LVNRKGVIFHQDNARRHTSSVTRQKLRELNWELLIHPPYSPDLSPLDYHLFRSLHNAFNGKNFDNDKAIKSQLDQFFADKNQKFYECGIIMLAERWQKVIAKMVNSLQNKVISFHEKIFFYFLKRNRQLLSWQPNKLSLCPNASKSSARESL